MSRPICNSMSVSHVGNKFAVLPSHTLDRALTANTCNKTVFDKLSAVEMKALRNKVGDIRFKFRSNHVRVRKTLINTT